MKRDDEYVPTNSEDYAKNVGYKGVTEPMIDDKNEMSSHDPIENKFMQINPIDPVTPSRNWATAPPRRGFNMDDLNTYIVREEDKKQAGLFDRWILFDFDSLYPDREYKKDTLGAMMEERVGAPFKGNFSRIKMAARDKIRTGERTIMSTAEVQAREEVREQLDDRDRKIEMYGYENPAFIAYAQDRRRKDKDYKTAQLLEDWDGDTKEKWVEKYKKMSPAERKEAVGTEALKEIK